MGVRVIADCMPAADQLGEAVSVLLSSPQQAKEMGKKAQQVVINEKGATERHAWVLLT